MTYPQTPVFRLLAIALLIVAVAWSGPALAQAPTGSVTLTWTAPGDDGNVGTAAVYDVRYSTSLITNANFNAAQQATGEPVPKAAGSTETFTVTGLQPNTAYYFAIKTADEAANWSGLSNVVNKTTGDTVPPAAVADLSPNP